MPRIDVLWWELEARADKYVKGIADSQTITERFAQFIVDHPIAVMGALATAFVAAADKAVDFADRVEASMLRIGNVMPSAVGHLDEMKDALDQIGQKVPLSFDVLLKGMDQLARLGATNPQAAVQELGDAARLAAATGEDLNTVITLLQRSLQAFNIPASESGRVVNLLMQAVQHGVPLSELEPILARAGAVASQAGVSMDKVVAAIISMRLAGEPTRAIVAALAGGLANMSKGLEVTDVATGRLATRISFANGQIQLAGAGADHYKDVLADVNRNTDDLTTASDKLAKSAEGQAQVIQNQLTKAWRDFGDALAPAKLALLKDFTQALDFITGNKVAAYTIGATDAANNTLKWWDSVSKLNIGLDSFRPEMDQLGGAFHELSDNIDKGGKITGLTVTQLKDLRTEVSLMRSQFDTPEGSQFALRQLGLDPAQAKDAVARMMRAIDEAIKEATPAAPSTSPLGGTGGRSGPDEATLAKMAQLRQELLDKLAEMTQDANLRMQAEFDKLSKHVHDVFGTNIPADVQASLDGIQRAVTQAIGEGGLQTRFKDLQKDVTDAIQATTETGLFGPSLDALRRMDTLITDTQTQLTAAKGNTVEEQKLSDLLRSEEDERKKLLKLIGDAGSAEADQNKLIDERIQQLRAQSQAIDESVTGAIKLGEAMGIVDKQTGDMIMNLTQMGTSINELVGGLQAGASFTQLLPSILGIAGSLGSILSGLFGESPQEKQARLTQENNTKAIEKLTNVMGEFGLKITGTQFTEAQAAVNKLLTKDSLQRLFDKFSFNKEVTGNTVNAILAGTGMTLNQLQDFAKTLGITLDTSNIQNFAKSLQQLQQAIAQTQLTEFAHTFAGQLQLLDAQFKIMNLTNPIDQLKALVKLASDPTLGSGALAKALAGIDLSTAAGQAQAQAAIQALFGQLAAGTLTPAQLGGMTPQEFLDLLTKMNDLINQAKTGGAGGTTTGTSQSFVVSQTITQVTGDRIAGNLESANYWLQQIEANTRAALGALGVSTPVSVAPPPPTSTGPGAGVSAISVIVNMGGVVLPTAQQVGQEIGDQVAKALDQQLGLTYRRRLLAAGSIVK